MQFLIFIYIYICNISKEERKGIQKQEVKTKHFTLMQLGIVCIKYQSNHPNRASPIGTNQMWNTGNSRPTLIRQKFCYSLVVIVEQALQWPLVSCARMCVRASVHVQWAPDQSWHCVHPASLVLRSSAKPYPPSHRHQVFSLSLFVNDSNLL